MKDSLTKSVVNFFRVLLFKRAEIVAQSLQVQLIHWDGDNCSANNFICDFV